MGDDRIMCPFRSLFKNWTLETIFTLVESHLVVVIPGYPTVQRYEYFVPGMLLNIIIE